MEPLFATIQLAALNSLDPRRVVGPTEGLLFRDVLLVLGVILLLTALLVLWAVRYAKRRKHHRHATAPAILQHTKKAGAETDDADPGDTQHESRSRHRRRRHRRSHRSRNPTLAETGGLPPVRPGSPENPTP